jgi:predicted phage terminase large subunit-like protein
VDRGEIDRLAIHMPPRHGKSETITVRYPVYHLLNHPDQNVLITGYNERFARKFGRRTRNIAKERGLVASDKAAADEWSTTGGGLFMARGVGSPPTGTGFNRVVIDDPIRRREDADSETYREKTWDWYSEDLYSRVEPSGAIIMVCTLWHEDDVAARAKASELGRWHTLNLRAISDEGNALWPDRFDVEALTRIRSVMGEYGFEALYQQNPTPREGSLFKVGMLEIVNAVPAGLPKARAWDMGATANDGDYTAGCRIEGPDTSGIYYVTDVVRGQWEPAERNRIIRQTAEIDGVECRIRGPQDPGAAGKESAHMFTRMLAGFSVKTAPVTGDKQLRAEPLAAQVNAGNVKLLRGDWNRAYIEEFRTFPSGKHDDQVDSSTDAFSTLRSTRQSEVRAPILRSYV